MTNVKQQGPAKSTLSPKQQKAAELARKTYTEGNVFKIIFKITFPVFILMIVNALYQMVDTIMAANFVDYGADIFGQDYAGVFKGAIAMQYILPIIMISMACSILINVGYGTMFSQKLGAGDAEGAKSSTSTALWVTFILGMSYLSFCLLAGPSFIKWNMPPELFTGPIKPLGEEILRDAQLSALIYTLTIFLSSFQAVASRQLRAEGHVKSMSYLPLISIPFNIGLDYVFMGMLGWGLAGAATASLIAIGITSFLTYAYAMHAHSKGTTMFSFSHFNGGINWNLLKPMLLIGMAPFLMQVFRIYNIELSSQAVKHLVGNIEGDPMTVYQQVGYWTTFYTAALRPMMLIMMPGMAVLQAGGAYLGYHYGAKNYSKVNEGILVMLLVMFIYAAPSWIILLSFPQYILFVFGVGSSPADITSTMMLLDRLIIGFAILNCIVMAANSYFISTKRHKIGGLMQIVNLLIIYTIVIVSVYFAVKDNHQQFFYLSNSIFIACQAGVAALLLGVTISKDNKRIKRKER